MMTKKGVFWGRTRENDKVGKEERSRSEEQEQGGATSRRGEEEPFGRTPRVTGLVLLTTCLAYSRAWLNFTVYRGVSRDKVLVANMSSAYAAHVFLSEGGRKTYR